jgi:hypothetical protein
MTKNEIRTTPIFTKEKGVTSLLPSLRGEKFQYPSTGTILGFHMTSRGQGSAPRVKDGFYIVDIIRLL